MPSCYPRAKWNQIVPRVGARWYFTGCHASGVCEADAAGAIAFDVNGVPDADATGGYTVTLWSWS
ncbi:hypothetical protein [Botrimarina sp.]|uniref:hypothetical protein n=1 Tax=Botrimarina sp. TaxID=2795802 RepID=UPI0032ED7409